MAVERLQCGLKARWQFQWIKFRVVSTTLLGHIRANVLPQISVHGHFIANNIFGNGHARQLHNAAFNRVH